MSQRSHNTDSSRHPKPKNKALVISQKQQKLQQVARPTTNDTDAWCAYWQAQNQPWRTEPEISKERQEELKEHRAHRPIIKTGSYPFKGMQLNRADVEWLLATQQDEQGLDVRGANLSEANLRNLPLAHLQGGLEISEWVVATEEQQLAAAILMKKADLGGAQLEGANLSGAQLEGVNLSGAHLEGANLSGAQLEGVNLAEAQLKGAILYRAHLEGANLRDVILSDKMHIGPRIADAQWGTTNLAVVNWSQVTLLGDENAANQTKTSDGRTKDRETRLDDYRYAVRANRQLAVALQVQGLNETAAHFAYRAQRLQRIVLRRERNFGQYLFSGFLDILAGYGYRPGRSVLWYLAVIMSFALAYHVFGHLSLYPPDAFVYSLTSFHGRGFFPGFTNKTSLHDPLIMLAAVEAVVGLLIEISFIATFTQRFFGK